MVGYRLGWKRNERGRSRSFLNLALFGSLALMQAASCSASEAGQSEVPAGERLPAPEKGPITVAFLLSPGATMIDFAGPWEVFQDVMVPERGSSAQDMHPFRLLTVAQSRDPIQVSAGMRVLPDYAFEDAPQAQVIVVPAQRSSPEALQWLRQASAKAHLTMSVCAGAFLLARAGLLDGRAATTHHAFLDRIGRDFPQIDVRRGVRYVEGPRIATAAGLTSGIDLALRVVERYFGTGVAERTAQYMEHESDAWRGNARYWDSSDPETAELRAPGPAAPVLHGYDPVLLAEGREVQGQAALSQERAGYRYVFADEASRSKFLAHPERYQIQLEGACALMAKSGAEPGSGDPDLYYVHQQRIYIFATESCRERFQADPAKYLPD